MCFIHVFTNLYLIFIYVASVAQKFIVKSLGNANFLQLYSCLSGGVPLGVNAYPVVDWSYQ